MAGRQKRRGGHRKGGTADVGSRLRSSGSGRCFEAGSSDSGMRPGRKGN